MATQEAEEATISLDAGPRSESFTSTLESRFMYPDNIDMHDELPLGSKLSIVVPVFNEGLAIRRNLGLLLDEVSAYFQQFEIIVVSDGSTDQTNLSLMSFGHPDVRPLLIEKNSGKGNAVRAGFHAASGDFILFIDGGMEIHPKEIRIFIGLMKLYECDIVVGSKRHPQSRVAYPWYRRFLSFCFQKLVRVLFDIDVTDTQVGIKLFRREVIQAVLPQLRIDRYGFDLELLCLAKKHGFGKILEAPIEMNYFLKNKKNTVREILHVLRVGSSLTLDTLKLYFRIRAIKSQEKDDNSFRQAI